ncbi:hypothetical protein XA68_16981 [Ophiocordyceps unilateralis]|uniref:Major facilitator superfamily (MFS) profile domain-containing protein n=1 Tax=Ophiocordyceps unilateralis TaxID=268505 RepID=A0A2A9PJN2_OPHUN|nr:hypothetical protein XA68_16981 [Ophiocordyceps unilateralis]
MDSTDTGPRPRPKCASSMCWLQAVKTLQRSTAAAATNNGRGTLSHPALPVDARSRARSYQTFLGHVLDGVWRALICHQQPLAHRRFSLSLSLFCSLLQPFFTSTAWRHVWLNRLRSSSPVSRQMTSSKKPLDAVQPRDHGPDYEEVESGVETTVTTRLLGAGDETSDSGRWTGFDDFEGLPWWRKPSVLWLLGPFSLFTLAFGGTLVPKLNLVLDLVCRRYYADKSTTTLAVGGDNPMCRAPEVQRDVATFLLVINLVTGGLSAVVAPKLGHLSDRYGRRRLLALASCGGLLGELITVLAAKFPETVDYRWLVLGALFDGMTGSFTAGSILSQSYTSDCTPPSRRAVSIGYIQACLFMGLAFGPLLSGYFVKWTGSLVSMFYVAIGCHAFFVLFAGFVIPESLSEKRQLAARVKWQRAQEARTTGVGSLLSVVKKSNPFAPLQMLWPTGQGTSTRLRLNLLTLAICDAIFLGAAFAVGPVLMLYAEFMFQWGNFETSRFVSILSLTRVVILMGLLPLINYVGRVRPAVRRQKRLGTVPVEKNAGADGLDIWILRIALVCEVLGCLGYTLARDQGPFVASGMMTAFGGLGSATTQAAVTKHVPPERVGQMLGAIGMLHALSRVVGPVIFSGLYAGTVKTFPQAVFLALGSLFAFALVATLAIKPHVHWHEALEEQSEPRRRTPQRLYSTIVETLPIDEDQVRLQ